VLTVYDGEIFISCHDTLQSLTHLPVLLLLASWELAFSVTHSHCIHQASCGLFVHNIQEIGWQYGIGNDLLFVDRDFRLYLAQLCAIQFIPLIRSSVHRSPLFRPLFPCHFGSFACGDTKSLISLIWSLRDPESPFGNDRFVLFWEDYRGKRSTARRRFTFSSVSWKLICKILCKASNVCPLQLYLIGMAPAYLVTDCQLVSDEGRRQLHSTTSRTCVVRRTYSNHGDSNVDCDAVYKNIWTSNIPDC